jgi:hypothetical protein
MTGNVRAIELNDVPLAEVDVLSYGSVYDPDKVVATGILVVEITQIMIRGRERVWVLAW